MAYAQKCHTMTAGAAISIDLGQDCGAVSITPTAEVMLRVDGGTTAPTAPGADPVAGNNATANYLRIKANVTYTFGADSDGRGKVVGLQDPVRYVTGWSYAVGYLNVVGH